MRLMDAIQMSFQAIFANKLRSVLNMLGILFGVGSVIAMLAIGEGASQEAQEQIRQMGSRNLLLASIKPPQNEDAGEARSRVLRYGLLRKDVEGILATADEFRPDIVNLPNSMLLGLAHEIRDQLDVPVLCTLQGEDIFLEELEDPE